MKNSAVFAVALCVSTLLHTQVLQARARTSLGAARKKVVPATDESALGKNIFDDGDRVRVQVVVIPFNRVNARTTEGQERLAAIPGKPLTHVLRARLDKPNEFFLGDWHIDTTPLRWIKKNGRYQLRLSVARRYGEYGQLEENLGSLTVTGVLKPQGNNVYMLVGHAQRRFRDPQGIAILDITAGFPAAEDPRQLPVAKK